MIRVAGSTVSGEFRINAGAASHCVFVRFENENTGAFAHDKPVALRIKRTASRRGIGIRRQRLHVPEPGKAETGDGSFRPSGNHDIGIPVAHMAKSFAQSVRTRSASADRAVIDGFCLAENADQSRRHIGNERGNHERRNAARTFFKKSLRLRFNRFHASDARTDDATDTARFNVPDFQSGIFHRLHCRDYGIAGVKVVALGFFRIHITVDGKVFNFPGNLARIVRHVETRHISDTALSGDESVPESLFIVPDRGNDANPGDDDSRCLRFVLHLELEVGVKRIGRKAFPLRT